MISNHQIHLSKLRDYHKLSDLCRFCGNPNTNMKPIFDQTQECEYSKIINTHFPNFNVSKNDRLPSHMCCQCAAAIMSWHKFYISCVDINKRFQTILENLKNSDSMTRENLSVTSNIACISSDQLSNLLNLKETNCCVENDFQDTQVEKCDFEVVEIGIDDINSLSYDECKNEIADEELWNSAPCDDDFNSVQESTPNTDDVEDKIEIKYDSELLKVTDDKLEETNKTSDDMECKFEKEKIIGKVLRKFVRLKKSTVCRICGKLYSSRTTYLHHLQKFHSGHKKNKRNITKKKEDIQEICYYCGKIFRSRASYRSHVRCQHSDFPRQSKSKKRPRRMCELCGKICQGSSFNSHMRKHADPSRVTCKMCNKVFSHESSLKNHHRVRHSNERPYVCDMCPSSFKRPDYLRSHIRYKHEVKIPREARIIRDETTSSEDTVYRCDFCGYRYKTFENYSKHLKGIDANAANGCCNSFACPSCGEIFKKRNYLLLHKKYVHDEKQPYHISADAVGPFKCDKCDRRFASITGRSYHCQKAHGCLYDSKINEKCDHCGLVFSNRVFFAKHQAKLQVEPTCYLCWGKFVNKEMLADHLNNDHGNDLPFVCELCNCRFVRLRQLNSHMRARHLGIKPFICQSCSYRSARKDSLDMHIRSCHLGEKPHKCRICGKGFSQRGDCRKHEVIHSKNK